MDKYISIDKIVHTISKTHKFDKEKLYAINTSDVLEGEIINAPLMEVSELKGQFKKTIEKGDLLFSEIRPANKRYAKVKIEDTKDYVVSTKLMVLRKYNDEVDFDYFYYCLTNEWFLNILQKRAENRICSFPQITFDLLSEYKFRIPQLSEQKRIAETLSLLDQKIALNTRINAELEAMAKQLYDYWFVQFDFPDENGNPYKSSGGKMVYNSTLKREIPAGWEVSQIVDILDRVESTPRLTTSEYLSQGKYPIIDQTTDIYFAGFTNREEAILYQYPAIVFGDHSCAVKYINYPFARGADGTQIVLSKNKNVSIEYLYFYIMGINIGKGYARHFGFVKDYPLIIPSKSSAMLFKNSAEKLFTKMMQLRLEIIQLIHLRDSLLPMLMNGQVTVE